MDEKEGLLYLNLENFKIILKITISDELPTFEENTLYTKNYII